MAAKDRERNDYQRKKEGNVYKQEDGEIPLQLLLACHGRDKKKVNENNMKIFYIQHEHS